MTDHLAIINPDDRGRWNLSKWLGRDKGSFWKVFYDGGDRLVLERTENPFGGAK